MTEIREPNFTIDLPGTWQPVSSVEAGAQSYHEVDGEGLLVVLLLAVRPVYAIADRRRLLDDYLGHRSKYEFGQDPELPYAEPVAVPESDPIEGGWDAANAEGRRARHRVLLVGNLLADFRVETSGLDESAFDEFADAVLGSAAIVVAQAG